MRILSFILIFICFCAASLFSQVTIAVQSGSTATFYTDFHTALVNAPSGATIYLPGGTLSLGGGTGYDTISKPLTIIGAGHYPDSTTATARTILQGNLYFAQGSDNCYLSGFQLTGFIQPLPGSNVINGISITRCNIIGTLALSGSTSCTACTSAILNAFISECVLGSITGTSGISLNLIVDQSIVSATCEYFYGENFKNDYFTVNGYDFEVINYCVFSNDVFFNYNMYSENNSAYSNDLFITSGGISLCGTCSGTGNITATLANTFVNAAVGAFSYNYNYHLIDSSNAINAGTDGTDIGIYGTATPYKEGGIPINPHIQLINIANQTGSGGALPVDVQVEAQNN